MLDITIMLANMVREMVSKLEVVIAKLLSIACISCIMNVALTDPISKNYSQVKGEVENIWRGRATLTLENLDII